MQNNLDRVKEWVRIESERVDEMLSEYPEGSDNAICHYLDGKRDLLSDISEMLEKMGEKA